MLQWGGIAIGAFLVIGLGFWCMSRKFVCCHNVFTKFKETMCWSFFIRVVLTTYLNNCLAANYGSPFSRNNFTLDWGRTIYICMVLNLVWYFFTYKESNELTIESTKKRWGSLYQGLKTENWYTLMTTILFFARRIAYIMALQADVFALKFGGALYISLGVISYYMDAKPFADKGLGRIEMGNELFFLLLLYTLPLFTPWVDNLALNYSYGWVFVYTLAPLFMMNVGYVIYQAIRFIITDRKDKVMQAKI